MASVDLEKDKLKTSSSRAISLFLYTSYPPLPFTVQNYIYKWIYIYIYINTFYCGTKNNGEGFGPQITDISLSFPSLLTLGIRSFVGLLILIRNVTPPLGWVYPLDIRQMLCLDGVFCHRNPMPSP